MKKTKKTLLTALAFTSAVSMTSCDLFGGDGFQCVYGPPPTDSSESSESSYNPYNDNMQTEYGAPIAYETATEETTTTATKTTTVTTTDEYDPIREEQTVVYGPPSYFE